MSLIYAAIILFIQAKATKKSPKNPEQALMQPTSVLESRYPTSMLL